MSTTETSSQSFLRTTRIGTAQRWSQTLIPTTREAPGDAELPSHILLVRAGFIRRIGAGIYTYLPLAWRTLSKISAIVREEMDAAGASELLMPALEPIELFKDTKRDEDYGDLLFTLTDRHGRRAALAPTHEEILTDLMAHAVTSYKQLPLSLYQIQTKYRDEFRPRAGLLRCREFIMKDAYSFHLRVDGPGGLGEAYDAMYRAYSNVFARCGLDFSIVEAESGPIGGSASHEFMVNAQTGEDTILRCPASGYAANVEKCEIGERAWSFTGQPASELAEVHTPGCQSIEDVAGLLKIEASDMLKSVVFQVTQQTAGAPRWVVAVVRGDHEVNEGKVREAVGAGVTLADEKQAREAGFVIGFVSPRVAVSVADTMLVVDPDAARGSVGWVTGADRAEFHVSGFDWTRELGGALDDQSRVRVADVRNAMAGDPSPRSAGAALIEQRGIEVGHIFKLGTKYSDAMGFTVLDENQQRQSVIMGCYGIGVSRTLAACVEMSHDDQGIVWPAAIAPFHVVITVMKPGSDEHDATADRLVHELTEAGIDVLIDDRKERPGVKFKDADLIGLPIRLTIGDKALAQGCVEFKRRCDAGKGELVKIEATTAACLEALDPTQPS